MREYMEKLKARGELLEVHRPVSPKHELAAVTDAGLNVRSAMREQSSSGRGTTRFDTFWIAALSGLSDDASVYAPRWR
jgi:hypothetical protein